MLYFKYELEELRKRESLWKDLNMLYRRYLAVVNIQLSRMLIGGIDDDLQAEFNQRGERLKQFEQQITHLQQVLDVAPTLLRANECTCGVTNCNDDRSDEHE